MPGYYNYVIYMFVRTRRIGIFLLSGFSWFNNNTNNNNCYLLYNYYVLINYAYRLIQYLFPKEIHGVINLFYFELLKYINK